MCAYVRPPIFTPPLTATSAPARQVGNVRVDRWWVAGGGCGRCAGGGCGPDRRPWTRRVCTHGGGGRDERVGAPLADEARRLRPRRAGPGQAAGQGQVRRPPQRRVRPRRGAARSASGESLMLVVFVLILFGICVAGLYFAMWIRSRGEQNNLSDMDMLLFSI